MAFTFDSTPGSSTTNSYISVEEANDYFGGRFGADKWGEYTTIQKQQLLVTATKKLDTCVYGGVKSKAIQALAWPRRSVIDIDGYVLSDVIIPTKLKEATCEMAYWIWTEEDRLLSDTDLLQVDTYSVGPMNLSINKQRINFPPKVEELLKSIGPGVLLSISASKSNITGISR